MKKLLFLLPLLCSATNLRLSNPTILGVNWIYPSPCPSTTACANGNVTGHELLFERHTSSGGCGEIWSSSKLGSSPVNLTAKMFSNGYGNGPNFNQGAARYSFDGNWILFGSQNADSILPCTGHAAQSGAAIDWSVNICDTATYANCKQVLTITSGGTQGYLDSNFATDNSFIYYGLWFVANGNQEGASGKLQWANFTPGSTSAATSPTGTFTTGAMTVTVSSLTGIANGQIIAGLGIPPGTTVTASASNPITISATPSAPETNQQLYFFTTAPSVAAQTAVDPFGTGNGQTNWYEPWSSGTIGDLYDPISVCRIYFATNRVASSNTYNNAGPAYYDKCTLTHGFLGDQYANQAGPCYSEFWGINPAHLEQALTTSGCPFYNVNWINPTDSVLDIMLGMTNSGAGATQMTYTNNAGSGEYLYPDLTSAPRWYPDGTIVYFTFTTNANLQGQLGGYPGVGSTYLMKYTVNFVSSQMVGAFTMTGKYTFQ